MDLGGRQMVGLGLQQKLSMVVSRLSRVRILRHQTRVWLVLLIPAAVLVLLLPVQIGSWRPEVPVLLGATVLGVLLARILVRQPSLSEAARLVEQRDQGLHDVVLTAVQMLSQYPPPQTVLAQMTVQDADDLVRQRDWSKVVPAGQILKWSVLSLLSFLLLVSSVTAASHYGRRLLPAGSQAQSTEKGAGPNSEAGQQQLVVEPGDTEVEQGSALTVVARFSGTAPEKAVLEFVGADSATRQISLSETVDAGVFAARMEDVTSSGVYRVLYQQQLSAAGAPQQSRDFQVTVFVRPKLEQIDAEVTPPAWSGRAAETVEDVVRLTVTEGSQVRLQMRLNKPVVQAELRPAEGPAIPLTAASPDGLVVQTQLTALASATWTVHLQDAQGRTPADEQQFSLRVVANKPATIKPTFPARDVNVSPLQEFFVEAAATDDFGLVNAGLEYSLAGGESREVSLLQATADGAPVTAAQLRQLIDLESLQAAPDDMVTYTFWAEDRAADGSLRRVWSDLLFAEVRRFEEIFREDQQGGQQQQQQQQQQGGQQGQGQQGSQVDNALELQKQIISATWNLIRQFAQLQSAGTLSKDLETLVQSQKQAIDVLQQSLAQGPQQPQISALAEQAVQEMTAAADALSKATTEMTVEQVALALPLEKKVTQTLLRMRAAEFQVRQQQQQQQQGQQSQSQGQQNSASQQQLQQLELDNNRNRYESQQQAQQQEEQQQSQEQREQLQVLNRLKELAQRQQMVNERLKQLESELRTAQTDAEREEIERELKRLRDEQREMLRDADELAERMQQSAESQQPQQQQMQQQMQEARSNMQRASSAMDEGRMAEAIAEGTRAERQFDELKEEFRNQTSSQFDEAVRELRDQARELTDKQQQLAQQLSGQSAPPKSASPEPESAEPAQQAQRPSLRSERNREQVEQAVQEQRDRLNRVMDQSKQLIEQAEETEPLLSDRLYETLRDVKDLKPEEALEAAEMLAERGLWQQTQEAEQIASRGLERLRDGIENAADAVLGSEEESLRRAQAELQRASQQLSEELRAAQGTEAEERAGQPGEQPVGEVERGGGHGWTYAMAVGEGERADARRDGWGRGRRLAGQP